MKRRNKKKLRKIKRRLKKKKLKKNKKKIYLKRRKIAKKVKRIKKKKIKFKIKSNIKLPNIKLKVPKFNILKKISIQGVFEWLTFPLFTAYENFREKRKISKLKKIAYEKIEREKQIKEERRLRYEAKKQQLKDEIKLAKEREHDLKRFIRAEQAILRKEQAHKRQQFLEEIKLSKKIESFRKRELLEIKNLEKLALKEQRENYREVEQRLEKIKEKYRLIRDQKIRERVEALGLETSDLDTKEDLLQKEKEYAEHRHTIELVLESFYRSANSLVFQLNKRYIPKHKSILRVIDRRYESNECFIRYDDSPDEDWLVLIYLEDSDAKKGKIVVENKANPDKHETKSFETKEIFTYSDYLVDSMTAHIDRERQKKAS